MKIATSIATVVVYLSLSFFSANAATKKILKEVKICKRNDPQISRCYCENFNKLMPVMKGGVPEMNIVPIDPMQVKRIRMEWPQTRAVQFQAELRNIILHGLGLGRAVKCNLDMTADGVQLALELAFPEIEMKARYNGSGRFMMLALRGNGDFWGNFNGMNIKSVWNSTRFVKHGMEHLKFKAEVTHLKMAKMQVHFTNLLGNSTNINDRINVMLNTNIDLLYNEVKPIILKTVGEVALKIINDLFYTFPFDILFPKN